MWPKKGKAHCSHMSHRRPRIHGPATILGRGTSFFRCSASRACSWQTRKTSKIYRHVELISGSTCYLATPKFQLQVFRITLIHSALPKKNQCHPKKDWYIFKYYVSLHLDLYSLLVWSLRSAAPASSLIFWATTSALSFARVVDSTTSEIRLRCLSVNLKILKFTE